MGRPEKSGPEWATKKNMDVRLSGRVFEGGCETLEASE